MLLDRISKKPCNSLRDGAKVYAANCLLEHRCVLMTDIVERTNDFDAAKAIVRELIQVPGVQEVKVGVRTVLVFAPYACKAAAIAAVAMGGDAFFVCFDHGGWAEPAVPLICIPSDCTANTYCVQPCYVNKPPTGSGGGPQPGECPRRLKDAADFVLLTCTATRGRRGSSRF